MNLNDLLWESNNRTQPNDNQRKQNQIVNEQDQLEKVNPSGQDSFENNQKNEKTNSPGKIEQSETKKAGNYKSREEVMVRCQKIIKYIPG